MEKERTAAFFRFWAGICVDERECAVVVGGQRAGACPVDSAEEDERDATRRVIFSSWNK